jgi:hypothetical protein
MSQQIMTPQEAVDEIQSVNSNPDITIPPKQALKVLLTVANRSLAQHNNNKKAASTKTTQKKPTTTTPSHAHIPKLTCSQQVPFMKCYLRLAKEFHCKFCGLTRTTDGSYVCFCFMKKERICSSCYDYGAKLLRNLCRVEDEEELEVKDDDPIESLPVQTVSCLVACLTKFEKDVEVCKTVLQICKWIVVQQAGRTAELTAQVVHIAKLHMDVAVIVQMTSELLQKLLDVKDSHGDTVLIVLNDIALEGFFKYQGNLTSDTMLSVIKLIVTLHDLYPLLVREVLLKSSLIKNNINVRSLQEYSNNEAFVEIATALIRRVLSSFSEPECLELCMMMENMIRLYPSNDSICEQVFGYFLERGEIEAVHSAIALRFPLM